MLLFNPSNEQIIEGIQNIAKDNFDIVVSAEEVPVDIDDNGDPVFRIKTVENTEVLSFPIQSAKLQYFDRIKVPTQFFNRCSAYLKRTILQEFHRNRNFTFRNRYVTSHNLSPKTFWTRAVLGPQYPTTRDDIYTFPVVLQALANSNSVITKFHVEPNVTELVAKFTDTRTFFDTHDSIGGPSGTFEVTGCLSITNSETGHSSLWIEPHIEIFDGMWIGNRFGDKVSARYVHRGTMPTMEELFEDIEKAKQIAQIGIIQYLEQCESSMTSKEAIKYMEDMTVLPNRFANMIEKEIRDQERILKVQLIRRILQATQELPLVQSLQIRREVGGCLGLFENTASRFANLANEINE